MPKVNQEIVSKLESLLDSARAGKVAGFSYFYDGQGKQTWGHIGLSDHGQLYASACLGGLAVKDNVSE